MHGIEQKNTKYKVRRGFPQVYASNTTEILDFDNQNLTLTAPASPIFSALNSRTNGHNSW
jgi:hypothetical protein